MIEKIRKPGNITPGARPVTPGRAPNDTFRTALAQEMQPVKFSGHAQQRLSQANRVLTPSEVSRVEQAVGKAAAKGSSQSLVLMQDLALVVSVANRTVVTCVAQERMRENVFTQIDSAVII